MEASKHWLCDDRSSLSAFMRRRCRGRAGCALSDGTMWAPVVEIADILGQELLQMALISSGGCSIHFRYLLEVQHRLGRRRLLGNYGGLRPPIASFRRFTSNSSPPVRVSSWHQPADFRAAAFPSVIWAIAAVVAAHADTCISQVRITWCERSLFL
jgi:hypothetical protein